MPTTIEPTYSKQAKKEIHKWIGGCQIEIARLRRSASIRYSTSLRAKADTLEWAISTFSNATGIARPKDTPK